MEKTFFIKDIRDKAPVEGSFLVTKKETGVSKAGKAYLIVRLMDSSGECEARVWDNAESLARKFDKNDVVFLRGFCVPYQGRLQINISAIERLGEGEYTMRDYLPCSKRDPEEMIRALDAVVEGMEDRHVRALLQAIFADPDVRGRFMAAPAAKAMHHPYLGGLLEHALSICGLVANVVAHYRSDGAVINRDLLMAGAILHDIGKIYELSYSTGFDYTDEGRLVGHITMGVELVDDKVRGLAGFPAELKVQIKHLLLSHHGTYEFGSPKRPKTLEAVLLSYLDDIDAKVNAFRSIIEAEKDSPGNWTSYQRMFERFVYKKAYLTGADEEGVPAEGGGEGEGAKGAGEAGAGEPEAKEGAGGSGRQGAGEEPGGPDTLRLFK